MALHEKWITSPAMTQCYTIDGIMRVHQEKGFWIVERSYKVEGKQTGPYKWEDTWHLVAKTESLDEAEEAVQWILAEGE
jgi:hypothetical protein